MADHWLLLIVFAAFVSVVFSALTQDSLRSQLRFGSIMFAGLVVSAVLLGWLMYPFPR
jgi:hypothetical protein